MKLVLTALLILPILAFQLLQEKTASLERKMNKNFAFIPSGLVVIGKDTSTVQAFYISKLEVTNKQYLEFLKDLKLQNKLDDYQLALPDTNCWISSEKSLYNSYAKYYFSHPAYQEYPVVGVSFEAANLYAKWYSEKIENESKGKKLIFRLPYREEFVRACRGENLNQKYAWKENGMRNKKNMLLCNYRIDGVIVGVAGHLNDNADLTTPVKSYWPNQFGIFNLNGNVAEMTNKKGIATGGSWRNEAEDVQNESVLTYEKALPNVGFRLVSTFVKDK